MPTAPKLAVVGGHPESIVDRRHPEWKIHHVRWRWLLDSWEGGEAYRLASYGMDLHRMPVRNLIRHKREYPDPRSQQDTLALFSGRPAGSDQYYAATDDDYTLRLARTPVPTLVATAVDAHLSGVYAREVERDTADKGLEAWWADVDGLGTSADEWMAETVAPLLMVLGCLDVIVDHPFVPPDVPVTTRADEMRLGLDRAVASVILPENVVWWELGPKGEYVEALICELQDDGENRYRHWTAADWTLYGGDGGVIEGPVGHAFGRVPVVRLFDGKRPRFKHVGRPRYEAIAEKQREAYNRESELILSDTTQAHPLLQGPEDYVQADGTIPVGPTWLLPKKKNTQGGAATYEGFDVVDFPKGGAESIRRNVADLYDRADRDALLTKPAGAAGTTGQTVAQSGVAKRLDSVAGNNLLGKIAGVLQKAETRVAELVRLVLNGKGGTPATLLSPAGFSVVYPKSFDLTTADELALGVTEFQAVLSAAGALPETEERLLCRLARLMLPGLDDDDYAAMDEEIKTYLAQKADDRAQAREGAGPTNLNGTNADAGSQPGTAAGPDAAGSAGPDAAPDQSGAVAAANAGAAP